MNRNELIEKVAMSKGLTRSEAKAALDGFLEEIAAALESGDGVSLVGFGAFSVRMRSERIARVPRDPTKTVTVPAAKMPVFKAGAKLKRRTNGEG